MTKLLGLSGALRKDSTNTQLLQNAADIHGADSYTLADLHLPLYDGDLETAKGIPASVKALADQIADADAVIIATPEYNSSLSGVLKNALDWVSRVDGNPWADKPVAIMSATAGRTGGARAQYALRACMTPFRPNILQGPEVMVAGNFKEFDDAGKLTGETYVKALTELMEALKSRST